jgi:hypothetical protein
MYNLRIGLERVRNMRRSRDRAGNFVIAVANGAANELQWARRMARTHDAQHFAAAIVAAITIGFVTPAIAQTTPDDTASRAQALSDARDQKAEELSVPRRSLVERGLHWYDTNGLRLGWRAIHFAAGRFPNGAGVGYGIGFTEKGLGSSVVDDNQRNRFDVAVQAARTIRGYYSLAAGADVKNAAGWPVDLGFRAHHYKLTQEDFYGLGDTDTSRHSNYRLNGNEFGAGMTWRATRNLSFGGEVSYLTPEIAEGTDARYGTTQSMFSEAEAPGLNELPSFVRADLSLGYDWRDSETHPRLGGQYKATISQYSGNNNAAFDFRRFDVSAQQIVPLAGHYRRLELRAGAAFTDTASASEVPFIYQPALGGAQTLRGYSHGRFRDRNAVWATAEYQWEAWWALDAAFFVDAGQVAAHRGDLALRDFDVTYGFGLRLHGKENFIARLDIARGREGITPILGFKYGF